MCWLHATWTRRSWQPTCVSMRETPASSTPSDEMEVRSAWSIRCISRSLGCSRTSRRMRAIVFGTSASSPSCPIGRRAAERRSVWQYQAQPECGILHSAVISRKGFKSPRVFHHQREEVGLPGLPRDGCLCDCDGCLYSCTVCTTAQSLCTAHALLLSGSSMLRVCAWPLTRLPLCACALAGRFRDR